LKLCVIDNTDVDCALGQLFSGFDIGHGAQYELPEGLDQLSNS
jgi:hypothetical protein